MSKNLPFQLTMLLVMVVLCGVLLAGNLGVRPPTRESARKAAEEVVALTRRNALHIFAMFLGVGLVLATVGGLFGSKWAGRISWIVSIGCVWQVCVPRSAGMGAHYVGPGAYDRWKAEARTSLMMIPPLFAWSILWHVIHSGHPFRGLFGAG